MLNQIDSRKGASAESFQRFIKVIKPLMRNGPFQLLVNSQIALQFITLKDDTLLLPLIINSDSINFKFLPLGLKLW